MNKDFKIYISILQTMTINAGRNCNLVAQYPAKFTVFYEFQLVVYCLTFVVVYRVTVIFLKKYYCLSCLKNRGTTVNLKKSGEKYNLSKRKSHYISLWSIGFKANSYENVSKKRASCSVNTFFIALFFSIFRALLRRSEKSLTFNRILQCHFYFLRKQFSRDIYRFSSKFKHLQISTY